MSMDPAAELEHYLLNEDPENDFGIVGFDGGMGVIPPQVHGQQIPTSMKFLTYNTTLTPVRLFNCSNIDIMPMLDVTVEAEATCTYSEEHAAWIHYKRNHFNLSAELICTRLGVPLDSIYTPPFRLCTPYEEYNVQGLMVDICAVKSDGVASAKQRVELFQMGPTRKKSEQHLPQPMQIMPGQKATYMRLHFASTTANNMRRKPLKRDNADNADQQEYFQLVVTLRAIVSLTGVNEPITILSKISDPVIVRGQNPKRFASAGSGGVAPPVTPIPSTVFTDDSPPIASSSSSAPVSPATPTSPAPLVKTSPLHNPGTSSAQSDQIAPLLPPPQPQHPLGSHYPDSRESWATNPDGSVSHYGNVGINMAPHEALTVNGNAWVSGNVYTPSDKRVKENIKPSDTARMYEGIQKLKLVDYNWKEQWADTAYKDNKMEVEHGLLAQQLREVLPEAVRNMGKVTLNDGSELEDMLAVNDKALLIATVGATQHLSRKFTRGWRICLVVVILLAFVAITIGAVYYKKNIPQPQQKTIANLVGTWQGGDWNVVVVNSTMTVTSLSDNSAFTGVVSNVEDSPLADFPGQFTLNLPTGKKYYFIWHVDDCPQYLQLAYSLVKTPVSFDAGGGEQTISLPDLLYMTPKVKGLPVLHQIYAHRFCGTMTCTGDTARSALYLSDASIAVNQPDIILTGNCGDVPKFNISGSCDDYAMISNLGDLQLTEISAQAAFRTAKTPYAPTTFSRTANVAKDTAYAILVNRPSLRYLLALRVTDIQQGDIYIEYAIMQYATMRPASTSPNFSCNATSVPAALGSYYRL